MFNYDIYQINGQALPLLSPFTQALSKRFSLLWLPTVAPLHSTPLQSPKASLVAKAENVYLTWAALRPDSSDADFEGFGDYFATDCKAWLGSMKDWQNPTCGRKAVIQKVKTTSKQYWYQQRDILSHSVSEEFRKVMIEGRASMKVLGHNLDDLFETVVITFDSSGLVSDLKVYTCRSHLILIMQNASGAGPYTEQYLAQEMAVISKEGNNHKSLDDNKVIIADCKSASIGIKGHDRTQSGQNMTSCCG